MANVKITGLTAITAPANTDVLPIVDVSADVTKKVSIADLLESAADGTAALPAFSFDSEKDIGMYRAGANQLGFATDATARLIIDSSGKVGIGATSPEAKLDVRVNNGGTASISDTIGLRTNSANGIYFAGHSGGGDIFARGTGGTVGDLIFGAVTGAFGSYVERLRIDSSGNVGIGTSSPSGLLHLETTGNTDYYVTSGASNNSRIWFGDSANRVEASIQYRNTSNTLEIGKTGGTGIVVDSSNNVGIGTSSPQANFHIFKNAAASDKAVLKLEAYRPKIRFQDRSVGATSAEISGDNALIFNVSAPVDDTTSLTERMRITPAGNVLIGTTALYGTGGVTVRKNITEGAGQIAFNRANTSNTSFCQLFKNNATDVGSISYTNAATSFNTSSDYRLKENVVNIADGIIRVKQLQPKRFNFIVDADTTVDGFLAHEAQAVVPEAVTGEKDGEMMQGIDQSKLVPLLTAALQEAIAKIETLETKVAALEAG